MLNTRFSPYSHAFTQLIYSRNMHSLAYPFPHIPVAFTFKRLCSISSSCFNLGPLNSNEGTNAAQPGTSTFQVNNTASTVLDSSIKSSILLLLVRWTTTGTPIGAWLYIVVCRNFVLFYYKIIEKQPSKHGSWRRTE